MSRLVPILVFATTTTALCSAAHAADQMSYDYGYQMRPSFDDEWRLHDDADQLDFEIGVRYWYSVGSQSAGFGHETVQIDDVTHSGEGFVKVEDGLTSTYAKGVAGYSFAMSGTSSLNGVAGTVRPGYIGYAIADFGWMPFTDSKNFAIGGVMGYQYWNDSPNIGRGQYALIEGPGDIQWTAGSPTYGVGRDSVADNLDIHALRLGITAKANFGEFMDVQAEVAAIPYAWVNGVLGAHTFADVAVPGGTVFKSSATALSGWAYGAAGEIMVGFHPTENFTVRLGGRAWYLNGQLDAKFGTATVTNPIDADGDGVYETGPTVAVQNYTMPSDYARLFRYGALAELTWRF